MTTTFLLICALRLPSQLDWNLLYNCTYIHYNSFCTFYWTSNIYTKFYIYQSIMFYATAWDPRLILSQIITIQCLYYVSLGFIIWLLDSINGYKLDLSQLFSCTTMNLDTTIGIITLFSFILCAFAG